MQDLACDLINNWGAGEYGQSHTFGAWWQHIYGDDDDDAALELPLGFESEASSLNVGWWRLTGSPHAHTGRSAPTTDWDIDEMIEEALQHNDVYGDGKWRGLGSTERGGGNGRLTEQQINAVRAARKESTWPPEDAEVRAL